MKRVAIFLLIVLFVCCLSGCGEKAPDSVKIGTLKGPTSVGMIKMIDENPELSKNTDSEYIIYPTPDELIAKLIKGEVDIAALPTNAAAKIYNKGAEYKLAGVSCWGVMYLVGTEEINSFEDIKGKKVNMIGKGMTPDIIFNYLAQREGLEPESDFELDYSLSQIELAQAMSAGELSNLAVLPEPFVTMVTMKNEDMKIVMDIQEEWNKSEDSSIAMTCLVVSNKLAEENPNFVQDFMTEYDKSINWVNGNTEQAGTLIEKHGILANAKIGELSIPRCNLRLEDAKECKDAVNAYFEVLYDNNPQNVGGKLPDEDFYFIQK